VTDELEGQVSTDHELILLLKKEIEELKDDVSQTEQNLSHSEENLHNTVEQLAIHEKLSAQHTILSSIFYGVLGLIVMMGVLVLAGWFTKQTTIEREMAFFERIILVFIGIVGGAVSSFFDVRNFTISRNNGNNNGKRDTD
jgi:FtsZ-binding cell division protein ZapB